ncbi:Triosephosphate isomerase [Frankliniella fusca]|uniref:Triosephosphate isomerase n=1 Tax=Frankliniella fusca TaxID=407009 RepID=A0AAE1LTR7_9NEOP|nr:Triosephosphate isomerase [Frankliniella fusca]
MHKTQNKISYEEDEEDETRNVQAELETPSSPEIFQEEMISDPMIDTSESEQTQSLEASFEENQPHSQPLLRSKSLSSGPFSQSSSLETSGDKGNGTDPDPISEPDHDLGPEPELEAEPEPDFHLQFGSLLSLSPFDDQEWDLESDEDSDNDHTSNLDKPVYSGATITLHESLVAILTVVLHFKVCGQLLQAILKLIQLHCLQAGNIFKTSLYFFKRHLSTVQGPKAFKYFCSVCYEETDKKGDGFYSKLRMSNESHVPGVYKDIYDGDVYQDAVRRGKAGVKDHITFLWYTDGAALFTSSKMSVWPLILTVNELPYSMRFLKQNVLIPVIWCGHVKPPSNLLINEAYSDLAIMKDGVKFSVKNEGDKIIKAEVLAGTGDTPARSLMLNMAQFNAACSCQCCEQEGKPRFDCPGVRVFPYKPAEMKLRTVHNMTAYAQAVERGEKDVVKGLIIKKQLTLVTKEKHKTKKWSVHKEVEDLNKKLLAIKPPAHIPRVPRPFSEMPYFKISELKTFALDYSLPVYKGTLSDLYLDHHATLVAALQILNSDVITAADLKIAHDLIHKYISYFPDLYDEDFLTINFHLLLHWPEIVKNLGPAWVTSCFPLENINGILLSLVHGTRWAERQIAASVENVINLPDKILNLQNGDPKKFCEEILFKKRRKCLGVVGNFELYGSEKMLQEVEPHIVTLLSGISAENKNVTSFPCLKQGKYLYVALSNRASCQRDSSAVVFTQNDSQEVGIVEKFLRIYNCNCSSKCSCETEVYALVLKTKIVNSFRTLLPGVYVPNTHEYVLTEEVVIVPSKNLHGVCVKMQIAGKLYISKPCNSHEIE